ncbi:hypothetical protein COCSUDRAFT_32014 [Coccomyxa subellipsoidea C-169]|uniref:Uncharacterized protein n=1 Tax=Coccomyxa subellipsoidea (strain C-169) TaxID=574566 RepID=I0Z9Z6_COCSC|nr:hypothetical protein COCSUDRAFT_32014 [Coccomyxa subellipsoidea C-169]EIE27465.1 hypothetical protein COCSUDRAFT_32014 [Coccomyxa subellipsoidea C-169]|eukprot:XP_005652009.1 hypothetical protein COCSUDRAFT_32014 [Coccomyxa subellipsoidea C-169]
MAFPSGPLQVAADCVICMYLFGRRLLISRSSTVNVFFRPLDMHGRGSDIVHGCCLTVK